VLILLLLALVMLLAAVVARLRTAGWSRQECIDQPSAIRCILLSESDRQTRARRRQAPAEFRNGLGNIPPFAVDRTDMMNPHRLPVAAPMCCAHSASRARRSPLPDWIERCLPGTLVALTP